MPELTNWKRHLVVQRDPVLGCIPTGYEWMLRVAEIQGISLATFQDDFNLQALGRGENNFDTIADAVECTYSHVRIRRRSFGQGQEKIDFIRSLIESKTPCLVSLTLTPRGGWHIMPVVYIDDQIIRLILEVDPTGLIHCVELRFKEAIRRHDQWPGGNNIAWLEIV